MKNETKVSVALLSVGFSWQGKPVLEASELLAGSPAAVIRHEGEEYLLEKTRNGKLILKK
ncbi:MAG: hemin uptake protein HemP [bacterium]|nr:hemin uptake protein HemP [bacterium]